MGHATGWTQHENYPVRTGAKFLMDQDKSKGDKKIHFKIFIFKETSDNGKYFVHSSLGNWTFKRQNTKVLSLALKPLPRIWNSPSIQSKKALGQLSIQETTKKSGSALEKRRARGLSSSSFLQRAAPTSLLQPVSSQPSVVHSGLEEVLARTPTLPLSLLWPCASQETAISHTWTLELNPFIN